MCGCLHIFDRKIEGLEFQRLLVRIGVNLANGVTCHENKKKNPIASSFLVRMKDIQIVGCHVLHLINPSNTRIYIFFNLIEFHKLEFVIINLWLF